MKFIVAYEGPFETKVEPYDTLEEATARYEQLRAPMAIEPFAMLYLSKVISCTTDVLERVARGVDQ